MALAVDVPPERLGWLECLDPKNFTFDAMPVKWSEPFRKRMLELGKDPDAIYAEMIQAGIPTEDIAKLPLLGIALELTAYVKHFGARAIMAIDIIRKAMLEEHPTRVLAKLRGLDFDALSIPERVALRFLLSRDPALNGTPWGGKPVGTGRGIPLGGSPYSLTDIHVDRVNQEWRAVVAVEKADGNKPLCLSFQPAPKWLVGEVEGAGDDADIVLEFDPQKLDAIADAERRVGITLESPISVLPQYITLDQSAALVGKSKAALEKYKKKQGPKMLPAPAVKGENGQADEWDYQQVMKPWLEQNFHRRLPERCPSLRNESP